MTKTKCTNEFICDVRRPLVVSSNHQSKTTILDIQVSFQSMPARSLLLDDKCISYIVHKDDKNMTCSNIGCTNVNNLFQVAVNVSSLERLSSAFKFQ